MKKTADDREPSAASLCNIPEVDFGTAVRVGRRGRYAHLSTGNTAHVVIVDGDIWARLGSANAINAALRNIVQAKRPTGLQK